MSNTVFEEHPLSQQEKLWGTAWLLFEILLFAAILRTLNRLLPTPLPPVELNFLFFSANFIAITAILRRYLLDQLRLAPEQIGQILLVAFVGFIVYFIAIFLVASLILTIDPNFSSINDDAVKQLVDENFELMFLGAVILVPVAEECLFRGVVFRGLYDRSPLLAWILSVTLFAITHLLGYVGAYPIGHLFLCFLQYLPAGICLASVYRLSGSILAPILIHAVVNYIGMMAMR